MSNREAAAAAVQRALTACMGPAAAEALAVAQVRVAWSDVTAEAGLERGPMSSRVVGVSGGTAHVEASDAMLAQELMLRAEALTAALNRRMRGRPGAHLDVRRLAVSVGRARR